MYTLQQGDNSVDFFSICIIVFFQQRSLLAFYQNFRVPILRPNTYKFLKKNHLSRFLFRCFHQIAVNSKTKSIVLFTILGLIFFFVVVDFFPLVRSNKNHYQYTICVTAIRIAKLQICIFRLQRSNFRYRILHLSVYYIPLIRVIIYQQ